MMPYFYILYLECRIPGGCSKYRFSWDCANLIFSESYYPIIHTYIHSWLTFVNTATTIAYHRNSTSLLRLDLGVMQNWSGSQTFNHQPCRCGCRPLPRREVFKIGVELYYTVYGRRRKKNIKPNGAIKLGFSS